MSTAQKKQFVGHASNKQRLCGVWGHSVGLRREIVVHLRGSQPVTERPWGRRRASSAPCSKLAAPPVYKPAYVLQSTQCCACTTQSAMVHRPPPHRPRCYIHSTRATAGLVRAALIALLGCALLGPSWLVKGAGVVGVAGVSRVAWAVVGDRPFFVAGRSGAGGGVWGGCRRRQ